MTMPCVADGWGVGWGSAPWGGAEDSALRIVGAVAIAENVVRVQFDVPPLYTGTLELGDASDPDRWSVTVEPGSPEGMDGLPARPVAPATIAIAIFPGAQGKYLDVTVDRTFSPYPARYVVAANNLLTVDGFSLDPCRSSLQFPSTFKALVPLSTQAAISNQDIANPQTLAAALDPLPDPLNPKNLGSIVIGDSGDYQVDQGPVNFVKRCIRRLITIKGAYSFDPNYGVSTPAQIKQLGRPTTLIALAREAESQLALEPETDRVRAAVIPDIANPGLFVFRVLVKSKFGTTTVLNAPVPSGVAISFT